MGSLEPRLTTEILNAHRHCLPDLMLSQFRSIEDRAAVQLPRQLGTARTIEEIADGKTVPVRPLFLSGLTSISTAAAKGLARHRGYLQLSGIFELPEGVARALSRHRGTLHLNRVTFLSDSGAYWLSKHRGMMLQEEAIHYVKLRTESSEDSPSLEAFTPEINGYLGLGGVKSLSDRAIEYLSRHVGNLELSGLETISDTAAKCLSRHVGDLHLFGLTSMSGYGVDYLRVMRGQLYLRPELRRSVVLKKLIASALA